ncbi:MAG: glycosyltransferase family 4 protein [Myxococcales bacterium]|nr:glycosyltransferase family 4 protein [Myxococcales bacterium]
MPSRRDMIPGAMLEMQSYGIPTLATDVGAIPEGAGGGNAALLCAPDRSALAEGLSKLLADAVRT